MQDFAGGGAERMMLNLAGGMVNNGALVDLVVVRREGPFANDVPEGVRVVECPARRVRAVVPDLVRYLTEQRPRSLLSTLAHVNTVAVIAGSLAGGRTRVVLREAINVTAAGSVDRSFAGHVAYRLIPWVYRRADALVGVSRGVADDLARVCGIPADQVYAIPNPVVTPRLKRMAAEPLRHPWVEAEDSPLVLGVGRLCRQKDFETLIRAVGQVRQRLPIRLAILGEGDAREALELLGHQVGLGESLLLPGWVENPFAWMARASVYVLSSRFEGSPNSLVEAMASGAPVVSTDCPSGPSEILAGGEFGELVEVGDPTGMAAAIERTVAAPRTAARAVGRASDFDASAVAGEYLRLLLN